MIPTRQPGMLTGIALLLPITLTTMAVVLLAPTLPKMLDAFQAVPDHEYWVPLILTVPALCIALLSPLAGMVGDRFGRRKLLLASFLVYATVGMAPLYLDSLWAILASRIGVGIAETAVVVLSTTMIGDYFKGRARDKWLAAQTAFASVSALIFFNVGGQLGAFGWRAPFWVYGSALLMFLLVLAFTWEPREEDEPAPASSDEGESGDTKIPWRSLAVVLGFTVYGSIFFFTVQILASSGLNSLGMTDPARIGFFTSIASLGVPLGTLFYSRIGFLSVRWLLGISFALLVAGFMVMGAAGTTTMFLIGCLIAQLGAGTLLPTLLVWAMSLLSFHVRARGAGLWQSAFAFGQFLCPVVVTFLAGKTGGLLAAFTVLGFGAALACVVVLLSPFRRGEESGASALTVHG